MPLNYITFPPILEIYSNDELNDIKQGKLSLPDIPCHSQDCERNIKQTSLSVSKNIGKNQQKSNFISTRESQKSYNIKTTKKSDFL